MDKNDVFSQVLICIREELINARGEVTEELRQLNNELHDITALIKANSKEKLIRKSAKPDYPVKQLGFSDHSILRYLERFYDIDLNFIKREMLPVEVIELASKLKFNGVIRHKGVSYVFKNRILVTIIKK